MFTTAVSAFTRHWDINPRKTTRDVANPPFSVSGSRGKVHPHRSTIASLFFDRQDFVVERLNLFIMKKQFTQLEMRSKHLCKTVCYMMQLIIQVRIAIFHIGKQLTDVEVSLHYTLSAAAKQFLLFTRGV